MPHGSNAFPLDRLALPDFERQLAELLASARERLAVVWIGVSELSVAGGRVRPRWRGCPEGFVRDLELEEFERLARNGEGTWPEVPALRDSLEDCVLHVMPLSVAPPISRDPDALLVVACTDRPSDRGPLQELKACVEVGLSGDRRLRLAAALYSAVEQSGDAIELSDVDGRLYYVNGAWERFSGYTAREALGRTAGELFRDPVVPLHDAAFYQYAMAELKAGRPWIGAIAGRSRDGHSLFYEVSVAPFATEEASFQGHVAIRRDLAHRSERDRALAVAHHEFRSVLSAIPDGVSVLLDGRVCFANSAFAAIVGRSEADVIGQEIADFVHPSDRAQFADEYRVKPTRVRMVHADGVSRFVEISAAGEISFQGRPALILLSRDTTDYQLAREELARAEKLSALGSLAAGVAHEINNPLAYVTLNLEVLSDHFPTLTAEDREVLDEAIEGVKRMREIAAELRTFSGSERPGPPEPVEVSRALTSALNIAQNEIRHRARLIKEFQSGLFVMAREGQLVQVVVNVLVNAAQAITTPSIDDQTIVVASRALPDGMVEIVVSDTGAGIPEEVLPRLFDPFSTTKRRGEGCGLGLAICKRIVQGFGGRIRVESSLGKGTTVTVELPSAEPGIHSRPARARNGAQLGGPRLRVLVVDDERSVGGALKRSLTSLEIIVVEDGHAALAKLSRGTDFDVVLCDLMMPGLPGARLYVEACRLRPELAPRFVFMTGGAVTPASQEFLRGVPCPVLWKPFDPDAALECIEQVARAAQAGAIEDPANVAPHRHAARS